MKRALPLMLAALALTSTRSASADAYVDAPSFGRIVFGMTGGAVVLPQNAWQGAYPDGSGSAIAPPDAAFGGGAIVSGSQTHYAGDFFGTPGSNFGYGYAGALAYNGGSPTSVAQNTSGVFYDPFRNYPKTDVYAVKLGCVASYGQDSQVGVYSPNDGAKPLASEVSTLFGTDTGALAVHVVTDGNPVALRYWSSGTSTTPAFDYYSDNPANNSGSAANQLYSHFLAYMVTDPMSPYYDQWFIGFEDTSFDSASAAGYHRFDYNDTVLYMELYIPEPAFYQLGVLLALGALGLLRLRKRA